MTNGAAAAAAADAARRRAEEEEDELMATSDSQGLAEDWEFKMLRANTRAFRKREVLDQVLQEEARSGWELHEKLDDNRLRFRRRRSARAGDAALGVDAYRTRYGMGEVQFGLTIFFSIIATLAAVFGIIFAIKSLTH